MDKTPVVSTIQVVKCFKRSSGMSTPPLALMTLGRSTGFGKRFSIPRAKRLHAHRELIIPIGLTIAMVVLTNFVIPNGNTATFRSFW